MRIRLLEAAQEEVDDAAAYYEDREEGRGHDFLDELDRAIRRIKSFPLASTEIEPGIRRCLLARFPYGIIYSAEGTVDFPVCGSSPGPKSPQTGQSTVPLAIRPTKSWLL